MNPNCKIVTLKDSTGKTMLTEWTEAEYQTDPMIPYWESDQLVTQQRDGWNQ